MPPRFWPIFLLAFGALLVLLPPPPVSAARRQKEKGPIHISADRLEYYSDEEIYVAEGSVVIDQGSLHLNADGARLDYTTGDLEAKGHVVMRDADSEIRADHLEANMDTELGILYRAQIFRKREGYYVEGDRIERISDDVYLIDGGYFTTCSCPENPVWRFRGRKMRLQLEHTISARDFLFEIKTIPVLYLPFFIFPAVAHRQTGFLVTQLTLSTHQGIKVDPAFFWAISKSQDATFSLDYRSQIGIGGGLQYRYVLDRNSKGTLDANYFADNQTHQDLLQVRYLHQQKFSDHWTLRVDGNYISAQSYFQTLSTQTAEVGARNVESNLILAYHDEISSAYVLARYTRDLTLPTDTTIQRLPEIGYSLLDYRLGTWPLYLRLDGTGTNFWRQSGLSLLRGDLYPRVSLPLVLTPGVTLTPQVGFRETVYSDSTDGPIHREAFPLAARLELRAYKMGASWEHEVTPSLTYEYIAIRDRPDVPQFDDVDVIHRTHRMTATIDNVLLRSNEATGWRQLGYFRLTDTYNIYHDAAYDPRRYSDLRQELGYAPTTHLAFNEDAFYDFYARRYASVDSDVSLRGFAPLILTIGHRYTQESTVPQKGDVWNPFALGELLPTAGPAVVTTSPLNFLTYRLVIKLPEGFSVATKSYYDVRNHDFIEQDYGLRYEGQCWGFTLLYLGLKLNPQFAFMVTLKGAGGFESKKLGGLF